MVAKPNAASDEVIYSTYPEFEYEYANIKEPETLPPDKQKLLIELDYRKIDGTPVTRISGFVGKRIALIALGQELQDACKTCGSSRMYELVLKRDVRKRAYVFLQKKGFGVEISDSKV